MFNYQQAGKSTIRYNGDSNNTYHGRTATATSSSSQREDKMKTEAVILGFEAEYFSTVTRYFFEIAWAEKYLSSWFPQYISYYQRASVSGLQY
jgi:hypothetical protein